MQYLSIFLVETINYSIVKCGCLFKNILPFLMSKNKPLESIEGIIVPNSFNILLSFQLKMKYNLTYFKIYINLRFIFYIIKIYIP